MEKTTQAFARLVREKLNEASRVYGVTTHDVQISLNLTGGTCLGKGGYFGGKHDIPGWGVLFNVQNLFHNWDDMVNDTIPHEVAHLVCIRMGWDKGHGPKWKRICRELGGTGKRCAREDGFYVHAGGSYRYISTYGTFHNFSSQIHKKIQSGRPRRNRKTGEVWDASGYVARVNADGTVIKRHDYDERVAAVSGRSVGGDSLTEKEAYVLREIKKVYEDKRRAMLWSDRFYYLAYKVGIKNKQRAIQFVRDTIEQHF